MDTTGKLRSALAALAIIGTVGLSGCGDGSSSDSTVAAADSTVTDSGITFDGMWARTSAAGAMMGAAYLTITSPVDDALLGAAVDASVAQMAQIHEVVPVDGSSMSPGSTGMSTDSSMAGGEMKMQEVDRVDLPAGTSVMLKPGGYHIMLMQLAKPLVAGEKISVTLTFENAGEKTVEFPVMDDAPSGS